eukprot:m.26778 g.26778  ORF g.26778 m.26778 type:complete len:357 (+) comp6352_c0_seq1:99-1169(+)
MGAYADLQGLGDAQEKSREKCLTHALAALTVFSIAGFIGCAYYMSVLHNDISQLQFQYNNNWTAKLTEIGPLQDEVAANQQQILKANNDITNLKPTIAANAAAVTVNAEQLVHVQTEADENQANITLLNGTVVNVKDEADGNLASITTLQNTINNAEGLITNITANLTLTMSQTQLLMTGLKALNDSFNTVSSTVGDQTNSINKLNGQYSMVENSIIGFQHTMEGIQMNVTAESQLRVYSETAMNKTIAKAVQIANTVNATVSAKLSGAQLKGTSVSVDKGKNSIQCQNPDGIPSGTACTCAQGGGGANVTIKYTSWNTVECDCTIAKDTVATMTTFCVSLLTSKTFNAQPKRSFS